MIRRNYAAAARARQNAVWKRWVGVATSFLGAENCSLSRWAAENADDAALIISELAANAVLHSQSGGQFFTVRADVHDTWCRLEVEDGGGPWDTGPRDRTRPHGLELIQALTGPGNWGVDGDSSGRVVWARPLETTTKNIPSAALMIFIATFQ